MNTKTNTCTSTETNPYPDGRWTQRAARPTKGRGLRIQSASLATLRESRLRELFWAAEDSSIVEDARQRIEATLANALATMPLVSATALPPEVEEIPATAITELQAA